MRIDGTSNREFTIKIQRIKNGEVCTECKKELRMTQAPEDKLLCVACMIPKGMLRPSV